MMNLAAMRSACVVLAAILTFCQPCLAEVQAWEVDPLIKVLRENLPPQKTGGPIHISAARGEWEAGQVAIRSTSSIQALRVTAGALRAQGGEGQLEDIQVNLLRYHQVNAATGVTPAKELAAKLPAKLPDAMAGNGPIPLPANQTQPAWITVHVPADAKPGAYQGTVSIDADGKVITVPLTVQVYEAVVPAERNFRLYLWLFYDSGRGWGRMRHKLGGEPWDDRDWDILKAIARNMVEHRQNMFNVPLYHGVLCGPDVYSLRTIRDGDSYKFDFSLFDRCAATFLDQDPRGVIVGGYLSLFSSAGRPLDDKGSVSLKSPPIQLFTPSGEKGPVLPSMDVDDPSYRNFLKALLPALQAHLEQKGWMDNFVMSINDETFPEFVRSRIDLATFARQLAPKLRFEDANRNTAQVGACDMWFPLPQQFEAFRDFYAARQKAGDEVGFYTCITPSGYNMNRFIDYPLIKTRLLPWYARKFGLTGYLHWGYNAEFPSVDEAQAPMNGDGHIVYRDASGKPVPSIRQEALRDGVEDYELLRLAEAKDKELGHRIVDAIVTDSRLYTRDVAQFRQVRELLLKLVSAPTVSPELRQAILALSTDHGWLIKPLPEEAPAAEGWKLVYSDDFDRKDVGENWLQITGKWAIKDGRLTLMEGEGSLLYAKPLGPNQRIEYDACSENPVPCDMSGLLCADAAKSGNGYGNAYFFGFGSEMNAFSKLMIASIEYTLLPVHAVPGQKQHVVCQRDGDKLSFWVDGKCLLNCLHKDRLDGPANTHAGLYMYAKGQYIDNVRIYQK